MHALSYLSQKSQCVVHGLLDLLAARVLVVSPHLIAGRPDILDRSIDRPRVAPVVTTPIRQGITPQIKMPLFLISSLFEKKVRCCV
jgi:hypothetical protein